jgi:hypothetical protein
MEAGASAVKDEAKLNGSAILAAIKESGVEFIL